MKIEARRQFLIYQKEREAALRQAHEEIADKFVLEVTRSSKQGKLPQAAHDRFIGKAQPYGGLVWELTSELRNMILQIVRGSLKKSMDYAISAGEEKTAKVIPAARKAELNPKVKAEIIDRIYGVLSEALAREGINDGMVELLEQVGEFPLTLSETIWDLSLKNLSQIRRIIASGIATAEESWSVAKKLREFLVMPEELWGKELATLAPGQGVYKSAYKNAMRVLRSVTNEAYRQAEIDYCKEKPWVVGMKWNYSHASPEVCAICYGLATADNHGLGPGVYPPGEYPSIPHPHCYCYGTPVTDVEVIREVYRIFISDFYLQRVININAVNLLEHISFTSVLKDLDSLGTFSMTAFENLKDIWRRDFSKYKELN